MKEAKRILAGAAGAFVAVLVTREIRKRIRGPLGEALAAAAAVAAASLMAAAVLKER